MYVYTSSISVFSNLSLHDALPILREPAAEILSPAGGSTLIFACEAQWIRPQETCARPARVRRARPPRGGDGEDRKSTRLNSSHVAISYAVFCLNKKNATSEVNKR